MRTSALAREPLAIGLQGLSPTAHFPLSSRERAGVRTRFSFLTRAKVKENRSHPNPLPEGEGEKNAARFRVGRSIRATQRIRVLHIINSFEFGGAEAMLCNLLLQTDRDRFEPSVVALIDDMTVAGPLLRAGIPIATMGMAPGIPNPRGIARLAQHLRRARPAVIQTWM